MAQRKVNCEVYTDRGIVGKEGKSAYQQAVEGGYQGTEEEFEQALASDIATVANNITNINLVGNNIENVNTAVDNMAAIIAAPTSATQAAASASQAATSATNAQTSETNASTSASNAATNATNASASATIATTKASEATSSATSASASANSASESATSASTSATNAQTWAEGADSAVTHLGGKHSAKGWASIAKQYAESIGSALKYKGSVSTYSALPSTGQEIGDTWNVLDTGDNYAWTGTEWDKLSGTVDLSAYRTSADQDLIDDTKATKAELAGYLPLTGGTLSGTLKINNEINQKISLLDKNNFCGGVYANGTSTNPSVLIINNTGQAIGITKGSGVYLQRNIGEAGTILCSLDKAVANGVASLDANAKVPSEQIPTATTSTIGGVKPDGNTITVTEDGTISAAISGEGVATKAELQDKVSKAGDTMTGMLKMSGANEVRFGPDDNFYYVQCSNHGQLSIFNKNNKGIFLQLEEAHAPFYWNGTNAYRLLTTADKGLSVGWGMPDYSAGVSLSDIKASNPYTAPADGYLYCTVYNCTAYVNNSQVAYSDISSNSISVVIILSKNDIVTVSDSSLTRCNFYPCKGV